MSVTVGLNAQTIYPDMGTGTPERHYQAHGLTAAEGWDQVSDLLQQGLEEFCREIRAAGGVNETTPDIAIDLTLTVSEDPVSHGECPGHPCEDDPERFPHAGIGETFYCDGSCVHDASSIEADVNAAQRRGL